MSRGLVKKVYSRLPSEEKICRAEFMKRKDVRVSEEDEWRFIAHRRTVREQRKKLSLLLEREVKLDRVAKMLLQKKRNED